MVNSEDFIKRLEKILDYYGLSAAVFADKVSVQRSGISHLLSGRNKPSLEFVMKVVDAYPEVNLYWFLNGKGTFPHKPEKQITATPPIPTTPPPTPVTPAQNPVPEKAEAAPPAPQLPLEFKEKLIEKKSNGKKVIEKVVLFYDDGSFEAYQI
ncbi:helix-turn-helix domain protein [Cellulophaga algicola DSM 14237]|uniref:Helix-turn-helix domain protein n=1 Tax=Cellulophaga algicola (strain DSM 14237 / IC166 / ACAM 630) TaxID=688270 RepID=E6XFF7_CELAD|nr:MULTISPECIES: helix-turn-helix transcriptional regulator [Cellulophaga]ADV51430.1 helix-turn-helix domain protein [Cellulophaga algicola DSM 14237]